MKNVQYEALNLKGLKFSNGEGLICETRSHFGLLVKGKGFVSFKDSDKKEPVKLPYANNKKVIQDIIDAGGLVDFSNVDFVNPINN